MALLQAMANQAAKWREGMQLLDSEIIILLLLKLEVTSTNCRRRDKRAVANDETTVPPTPKLF